MRKSHALYGLLLIASLVLATVAPLAALAQDDPDQQPHRSYVPIITTGGESAAAAARRATPTDVVTAPVSVAQQTAADKFWTSEKLQAAQPLDLLTVSEQEVVGAAEAAAAEAGAPGRVPAALPDADAQRLAAQLYPAAWAALEEAAEEELMVQAAELLGWSSSPAFVSYFVNRYTQLWKIFPHYTVGRLFFTVPGQGNFSCTAGVATGRAVWTAGHCVFTPGVGFHTNVIFIPAYRNGNAPYGQFVAFDLATLNGWVANDLRYDIGMIAVRDRNGRRVSQWVGSLGFLYNASTTQLFHNFGYPGNLGNNGAYSILCVGQTSSLYAVLGNPRPKGQGCDMTFGASGGPWLVAYMPLLAGPTNYVNGVNSFIVGSRPNQIFSAHFTTGAKNLFDWGALQ
jgi:hypothetical protein